MLDNESSAAIALRAEVKIPLSLGGHDYLCPPPTRKQSAEWLERIARCYEGDVGALMQANDELPALLGIPEDALESLTPMEAVAVAVRFFCHGRAGILDLAPPMASPADAEPAVTDA